MELSMSFYAYDYLFGLILVSVGMIVLSAMVYYRVTGKTILGQKLKAGTIGHRKMANFSSNMGILIASVTTIIFIENLFFAVRGVRENDSMNTIYFLIFATFLILVLCALVVPMTRKAFRDNNLT
jgi:hypothetical protein